MTDFKVGIGSDLITTSGDSLWGDIGLNAFHAHPQIHWQALAPSGGEVPPEVISGYDAILLNEGRITARTLSHQPPRIIARFGVGFDAVDLDACTEAGVVVTNTPDGVRRPMGLAALTMILAVAHNLVQKDRLVRENRWDDRLSLRGRTVTGATIGIVGLGNIGREILRFIKPLQMRQLAHDPFTTSDEAGKLGVALVSLETLLAESDYVLLTLPLTPSTHHLIGSDELRRMRNSAALINLSRGPIVDESALVDALITGEIAGAGLDVFESEPLSARSTLLGLDNVTLTPHALCWTDELALGNGSSAVRSIIDVALGTIPRYVVNPAVLQHPRHSGRLSARQD